MKKTIKKIFMFSLLVAAFASCKKDENRITYSGGTAPVLAAVSTADLILSKPNATLHAISFSWTNPDYQLTTGVSSQDVTYYLQVDTAGSNFTTPGNTSDIAIAGDLSIDLNDSILNRAIAHIGENGLVVDVPHSLEFRIKSTLHGGSAVLYSNVISVVVTPYLDVAVPIPPTGELWLTGSGAASGWTNDPPANQKFTKVSDIEYFIIVDLAPALQLKFLSTPTFWQPQYGLEHNAPDGTLGFNMGGGTDPVEIPTPAVAGTYKITVLFGPGKYTLVKQ